MIGRLLPFGAKRRERRERLRERRLVAQSGLFNAGWYLSRNPDVAASGQDPLDHFLRHGAREGRPAGPDFDTRLYLAAYPELADGSVNALLHYLERAASTGPASNTATRRAADPHGGGAIGPRAISFSIILLDGPPRASDRTLESLRGQNDAIVEVIAARTDPRMPAIRAVQASPGGSFLGAALDAAVNDYVVLLDPGDIVLDGALTALADHLAGADSDIVYSDEHQGAAPVLKPGWSPELLDAYNYFGRLTAIRRGIALAACPDPSAGAASEWSLNLGASAGAGRIDRLPVILCRRTEPAACDRVRALTHRADYEGVLQGLWADRTKDPRIEARSDGTFHVAWPLPVRPRVSVVIPQAGDADGLRRCLDGLLHRTDYPDIDIVVVGHRSTTAETEVFCARLGERPIRFVPLDGSLTRARAYNLGASVARGELLLFLDPDLTIVEGGWLDALVGPSIGDGVGVVGPKLLAPDGRIREAGIGLGLRDFYARVFEGAAADDWGVFGSPDVQRNVAAVSGACQLVARSVFERIGGYDERYRTGCAAIAFCLDAARAGLRTVYAAGAVLTQAHVTPDSTDASTDRVLLAERLRALGIEDDSFLHPALDARSAEPRLREHWPEYGTIALRRTIEHLAHPLDASQPLDLFDDGAVAAAAGLPWNAVTWRSEPGRRAHRSASPAGLLIDLLRRRPDLRTRFPRALSEGRAGRFAEWAGTEGIGILRLSEAQAAGIAAAFATDPGARARQYLTYDTAFRSGQPLFLLPNGRRATCRRLFEAVAVGILALEEVWWFLLACAEAPLDELCATWAITPAWQEAVPDGGSVFGIVALVRWVSETYGIASDWLFAPYAPSGATDAQQVRSGFAAHPAWRDAFPDALTDESRTRELLRYLSARRSELPFVAREWARTRDVPALASELRTGGVNILGHFSYPSGLRISAESMVEGLRMAGVPLSLRDVPIRFATDEPIAPRLTGSEVFDTTIIHVQPQPLFNEAYARSGLRPRDERTYRIGYWYWEFDQLPPDWNRAALDCDEFWTATEFVAEGLRRAFRQPVRVLPPGVELPRFDPLPRAHFDLPEHDYLFLFAFHMTSVMERKNPLGLIEAFRQAFRPDNRAKLVIKTAFGREHPEAFAQLQQAAGEAGVILIDATLTWHETLGLMAACDAYVSLHRSEGLGLSMAEAMLLGKPVIATRYSGNLDFMDDGNSLLVDFRLVTLDRDLPPYQRGLRWAEPSLDHAAAQMRRLYADRAFGEELGSAARADLATRMSCRASGRRMAERLAEIAAMP
ncbi:glycosyltransferase [Methylobacterium haplocladii]|uniref:Glycosyltransferase 2-like domain-containing protein n=1 Tax=Methylobacterium haplocladii TaxID=1176176 RepID=A0A512IMQ7_9HYPH|nr:glycosyltransferase [Methylobacterium haplocladii]GEO98938.1 hypothetical protein MHA02_13260 [Methylobacterium haplocladii]GJD84215.1 D-inositol-3-phosphate glycosyltransferase [Methylobacterium haplocladii]GLS60201.1 hypothetical protein GCM10007887_28790 [Methylobacterium haplocladii]